MILKTWFFLLIQRFFLKISSCNLFNTFLLSHKSFFCLQLFFVFKVFLYIFDKLFICSQSLKTFLSLLLHCFFFTRELMLHHLFNVLSLWRILWKLMSVAIIKIYIFFYVDRAQNLFHNFAAFTQREMMIPLEMSWISRQKCTRSRKMGKIVRRKNIFNYRCLDNKLKISTDLLLSNTSREVTSTSVFFFYVVFFPSFSSFARLQPHDSGRCSCVCRPSNACMEQQQQ